MKSKNPSWQGEATVRPRRQGRRGVAFTGAKRKPLTEGAGGSGAGLARKGKAKGGTRSGKSQGDCRSALEYKRSSEIVMFVEFG
jgi:hypothetical protein